MSGCEDGRQEGYKPLLYSKIPNWGEWRKRTQIQRFRTIREVKISYNELASRPHQNALPAQSRPSLREGCVFAGA